MTDDEKEFEIAIKKSLRRFRFKSKDFPIDRMNYAYEHWPMGQTGGMDLATFLMNKNEASLTQHQWEASPALDRRKRKTRQNPNHKATEE